MKNRNLVNKIATEIFEAYIEAGYGIDCVWSEYLMTKADEEYCSDEGVADEDISAVETRIKKMHADRFIVG